MWPWGYFLSQFHTLNFSVWYKKPIIKLLDCDDYFLTSQPKDTKIVQFVSTESSFLHIMIRHNVEFCKDEQRYMPLTIFQWIVFYCWWRKWVGNNFYFIHENLEQRVECPYSSYTSPNPFYCIRFRFHCEFEICEFFRDVSFRK